MKSNYLKLLFEQFKDPITAEPKWTKQCLTENIIGSVEEQDKNIVMASTLYMNYGGSMGFCSDSRYAGKAIYLILYCEGSNEILEFKYSAVHAINFKDFVLCP